MEADYEISRSIAYHQREGESLSLVDPGNNIVAGRGGGGVDRAIGWSRYES